jgi:hypothetical protein
MGCLIQYAVRDGTLRAVVSGKASSDVTASWIARDIARQAGRETVKRVLIDVRGLGDRLGSLGTLSLATANPRSIGGYRVAMVDAMENDNFYALHEMAAVARGYVLKCFSSAAEAARWLRGIPGCD